MRINYDSEYLIKVLHNQLSLSKVTKIFEYTIYLTFNYTLFYKCVIPLGFRDAMNFIPSAGGVSAGRGGFSFLGGRRSLTGWIMYPKPRPTFFAFPSGNWDGAKKTNIIIL